MRMCVNFTVDNYLSLISLVFVAIGGLFVYQQWKKNLKIKRAEFIYQILEKLRIDKDIPAILYIIDYNQEWYDSSFHDNSELESSIDKTFSYLDYICYLKQTNNITKTEFKIFQYEIHRVCISSSSKKYLWNLYHFSKKNGTPCTFQYLIDYGVDSKILKKDFKTNTTLYSKILNW
jgi:hypothetical protein